MAVDRLDNSVAVRGVAPQITGAISKAADSTGISFQYLLTTARIESSFNPQAQASTSSAKGLYQFLDQTWLATVKRDGAELGMSQYADAISQTSGGRYEVADPAMRAEILKMRTDPAMSAMMAGALARNNAAYLTQATGKVPTEGELYAAHFLGPQGAGRLINAVNSSGNANAASMFPAAAAANRPIFYNRDGSARTVTEVYDRLTSKFDNTRLAVVQQDVDRPPARINSATPSPLPAHAVAPVTTASLSDAVAPANARTAAAPVKVPDTAGMTQALAAADNRPAPQTSRALFAAMFSDPERGAVTRTVASLWTDPDKADGDSVALSTPGVVGGAEKSGRGLDLFSDGKANVRGLFLGRG